MYNHAWVKDIHERPSKKETPKSVGHSKTSVTDLTNIDDIYSFILDVVQDTCNRLRKESMKANTITVTLKTSNFKVYSMAQTIDFATNGTNEIFKDCKNIFNKMYKGEPLRLIGISLSNLEPDETTQLNLFETFNEKEQKLDKTVDNILNKFNNSHIITRASLIHHNKDNNDTNID